MKRVKELEKQLKNTKTEKARIELENEMLKKLLMAFIVERSRVNTGKPEGFYFNTFI